MSRAAVRLCTALLLTVGTYVHAEGRFGLSDPAMISSIEERIEQILEDAGPPSLGTRGAPLDPPEPDEESQKLLNSDPALQDAWRADPRATQALIDRIRGATENN